MGSKINNQRKLNIMKKERIKATPSLSKAIKATFKLKKLVSPLGSNADTEEEKNNSVKPKKTQKNSKKMNII